MLPTALLLILVKLIFETGKVEFISGGTIMITDIENFQFFQMCFQSKLIIILTDEYSLFLSLFSF